MAEEKILSDSEKLDVLNKRLKRIQYSTDIQTAILVIGFLGIVSLAGLMNTIKNKMNNVKL